MLQEIIFPSASSHCRILCPSGGGLVLYKTPQSKGESIDPSVTQLADGCLDAHGNLYLLCHIQGGSWALITHESNSWQKFPLLSANCQPPQLPFSHFPLMFWAAPQESGWRIQARDLSQGEGPCHMLTEIAQDALWSCAGDDQTWSLCHTDKEGTLRCLWGDRRGLPRCHTRTLLQGKQETSLSSLLVQGVLYVLTCRKDTYYLITCPMTGAPMRIYDLVGLRKPTLLLHNRHAALCYYKDKQWLQRDLAPHIGTPWECAQPNPHIKDLCASSHS